MLCKKCKKNQANIHVTRIVNGKKETEHLCPKCAADLGLTPGGISPFGGFEDLGLPGFFEFPDIFSSLLRRRPSERIYDYFSEEAQKVVSLAREEAKRLSHGHVNPEHILLGIIKEEGMAAKILEELGVKPVELFSDIESLIGRGDEHPQKITLSPQTKKVFDLAFNSAREMGSPYIGPEHFLLGLMREENNIAAQALHKRKVKFDDIAQQIIKGAEEGGEALQPEEGEVPFEGGIFGMPGLGMGQPTTQKKPALSSFGKDLTEMARQNQLDPVIDRQKEVDRVIRILSRRTKNNPALLGDPGVGKTAIVEGLAQRIVKGEVPSILKDKQVVALDLGGMVAGTKYRGEFEARVKKVLDEILAKKRKIILFIDELHTLVGAGGAEGAIDAANMLKPALARGELQVVGATTVDEYRKNIEKDAALERRFQPVLVNEPSVDLTIEILKGIRDKYEEHHGVKIPDAALVAAATLSNRYISDRFLPDKAIDVMDEAAAKVRLKNISSTDELKKAKKEIKELEEKKKLERGGEELTVTEDDIAEIVSDWTGIPVVKLTAAETDKLIHMESELHKRIIGQDEAVVAISQAIRRGRAGLKPPQRPLGSFIFAGPTGVGKTEVARRLSEFLFGTQEALVRIDMSEYMEKHTVSRLIGAPPGYVGYEEGGALTEAVRRKPYSVILFDEIDKAHPDVFNVLLQIMEDGRLTDSKGHVVDFKNTVVIMTSNVGQKEIIKQGPIGFMAREDREANYEKMKELVLSEMKKAFRPEFLNRIDEIIVFHPLSEEELKQIAKLIITDLIKQVESSGIKLEVTDGVIEAVMKDGYDPHYGARPLKRSTQKLIENPLSNQIIERKFKEGDSVLADVEKGKLTFKKTGKADKKKSKKKN
jgi:ATP-dependent Clp protease ATP-binding subunit ClpC